MTEYEFKTAPMAHQVDALRAIIDRQGVCALLLDPGTGKTKVVIDYMAMLYLARGVTDWLVTAPLSALDGWPEQLALHLPDHVTYETVWMGDGAGTIEDKAQAIRELEPVDHLRIVLINHDAFGSKVKAKGKDGRRLATVTVWDRLVTAVEAWKPDGLVVDESHRMKRHTAHRSKALQRIARVIDRRLLLTGTVAPRNPLDLFGQWLILNPQRFGTDYNRFRFTYARWGGWMGKEPVAWINTDDLREKVLLDAIVVKKEDALDLPPVTEVVVAVHLSPAEERAYVQMGAEMLSTLPSGEVASAPIPLTRLLRQRQLTGGYVGREADDGSTVEERLGESKAKVAVDLITDLTAQGEKVVVFAHFRPDLDILEQRLIARLEVPIYRIDGSTPKDARMHSRRSFRDIDGPAVMLAQMRTMSLGVNELTVAAYGIVYSLSDRRDDFDQALDRLDRQGQSRPVTIYHLAVPRSVDEWMLRAHQQKLDLEAAITRKDAEHYMTLGQGR